MQDPTNIKAAELLGKLHDTLENIGYIGHPLEVYLVRILFLLFAEDTSILEKQQFQDYVEQRTNIDGSDLAAKLQELFQVLNTPKQNRFKNLDEQLADFPYVNGKLFDEILPTASFDSNMRQALLACCYLDWSKISPAIFGSMFQSVMNPKERRNLGAHYTSETNILKVIKPLFLDALWTEFEQVKDNKTKLQAFHTKLSTLQFLDPACGCGNFLIITYRALRLIELEVIKLLLFKFQKIRKDVALDADIKISSIIKLNINQFYGIEYEEFPTRIAEVAMLLIDHQMNLLLANEFGQLIDSIPIKSSSTIINGNALQIDWATLRSENTVTLYADTLQFKTTKLEEPVTNYGTVNVVAGEAIRIEKNADFPIAKPNNQHHYDYIIGNPPFCGSRSQTTQQKEDTLKTFGHNNSVGVLDYVTCWFYKASKYITNKKTKVAFVSTDSICQGVQVPVLWKMLLETEGIFIHFAHQTFNWSNEAKNNAAVYCIIVGFAKYDSQEKYLYEYKDLDESPTERKVTHINPYLLEQKDIFIEPRTNPIDHRLRMMKGNAAIDDGNFIFNSTVEANNFIEKYPQQSHLVRKFIGSDELINNINRYCLWLKDAKPDEIKNNVALRQRVDAVRTFREKSPKAATRKCSETPTLFMEDRQPNSDYLMIPVVSSENRKYIPIGFLDKSIIANYSSFILPDATIFEFGIISSLMHHVWILHICGKLEGRIRYSNTLGYNNFPFPENLTQKQRENICIKAQNILTIRDQFSSNSLAELYHISAMPPALIKAHQELDKAVDIAYRNQPFTSEMNRMEFLVNLYEKYATDLFTEKVIKKTIKQ